MPNWKYLKEILKARLSPSFIITIMLLFIQFNIIKSKFRINTIKYKYSNHMSINSVGLPPQDSALYQNNSNFSSNNIDKKILQPTGLPFSTRQTITQTQPFVAPGPVVNLPYGRQQIIQGSTVLPGPPRASILSTTQPPLIMGSRVQPVGIQTASRVQTIAPSRQQSIKVFRATGPPIVPINQGMYRPSQSIVRPLIIDPSPAQKPPVQQVITPPRQISYRDPIEQTIYKQRSDPQRQKRKTYYNGPGYKQQSKGFPWLKALIGLLALAGLLTGLFFLIRAINQGSNNQPPPRQSVNFKQNATVNTTVPTQPLSPIVIDVNTNPPGTLNNTNTSTTTNVTVINTTNITTNTSSTTNTSITVNPNSIQPIVVPPTQVNSSTTTPGVQPVPVPGVITNTTTNTNTTTTTTTTNVTTNTTINPNTNTNTTTTNTSTNTNTNTNTNTTTPTNTNTNTSTSTSTNTTATVLTGDQIASDVNVRTIDGFLRKEDALRLGTNANLKSVSLANLNGAPVYYLIYDAGQGKKFHYWVSIGPDNHPQVKAVKITQQVVPTSTHSLQVSGRHRLQM